MACLWAHNAQVLSNYFTIIADIQGNTNVAEERSQYPGADRYDLYRGEGRNLLSKILTYRSTVVCPSFVALGNVTFFRVPRQEFRTWTSS